jgi:hypothetical protein
MTRRNKKTRVDSVAAPLLVDWRWRPGLSAAPDAWLNAFEAAFPDRALTLMIDHPLDPDHKEVLQLVEALAGRTGLSLLIPTFLDGPMPQFIKRLPLISGRLHVAVWLDPNAGHEFEVRERLLDLRESGCEAALLWSPRVPDIRLVPERLGRLADDGFVVCVLPPRQSYRAPDHGPAMQAILLRYAHPEVVRWMFAQPDVFGRPSTAGVDSITVQPDGTLYASPDDVTRNLGNLFRQNARLLGEAEPLRQPQIRSWALLASLPEIGLPPLAGNPVSAFLKAGGVWADKQGVHYPLRFVDWEDDRQRVGFGLAPLRSLNARRGLLDRMADWIGGKQ